MIVTVQTESSFCLLTVAIFYFYAPNIFPEIQRQDIVI